MAKTAAATPLDIAELPFSDLIVLLSPDIQDDDPRLFRVLATVGTELGRGGSGLLAIAGVPRAGDLRHRVLPLAQRLALMDHSTRAELLKKHGLGSDVPMKKLDRSVSSFVQLLRHSGELHLLESMSDTKTTNNGFVYLDKAHAADGSEEHRGNDDTENLGELVNELGLFMMELGILVARACDIVMGGGQLEQSISDFGTAKARLIHYHSEFDSILLRETSTKRKGSIHKASIKSYQSCSLRTSGSLHPSCIKAEDESTVVTARKENGSKDISVQGKVAEISLLNLWQEWHYDYGIFTVLTAPLFLRASVEEERFSSNECCSPNGHTHLQLCNGRELLSVRCSPDSFIVQVGEAADILSGGKLKSTMHAVSRPLSITDISRETFVVFLQPSWDKILTYSGYSSDIEDELSGEKVMPNCSVEPTVSCVKHVCLQEILKNISPLSSRLIEGMTFAEFSRQTTKKYYGGGGIQQNN